MSGAQHWVVETRSGTAHELQSLPEPVERGRVARVLLLSAPAIVLGSTQPDDLVDRDLASRAGVDVARRRSGGGAVLLVPGEHVWVDLFIAAGDELWDDDVVAAAAWVGDAWRGAIAELGLSGLSVHRGGLVDSRWSELVCFAGRGPGEVFTGDRKVVGVSQRRTRDRVRVQTAVHRHWDVARTLDLFDLGQPDRGEAEADLARAVGTVDHDPVAITGSLFANLPD